MGYSRNVNHLAIAVLLSVALASITAFSATKTWTGATSNRWALATNWTGGIPGAADTALFTDASALPCSLWANATVKSVVVTPAYIGTFSFGNRSLILTGNGDFRTGGDINPGTGTIVFAGSTDQLLYPPVGQLLPNITQSGSAITTIAENPLSGAALRVNNGQLNLGNGLIHSITNVNSNSPYAGTINFGSSTLKITTGAANFANIDVTAGSGRVVFAGATNQTFTPQAGMVFPTLVQDGSAITTVASRGVHADSLIIIQGTFALGNGLSDTVSTVVALGGTTAFGSSTLVIDNGDADFSNATNLTVSTGTLSFAGSGMQRFVSRPGSTMPKIVHGGTGTLALADNIISCLSFTQSAGVLDFGTCNITTLSRGNFTVTNGTSSSFVNLGGRTITVAGTALLKGSTGNLLNCNPSTPWTISTVSGISGDHVTIGRSVVLGSAGAASACVDDGGNTNWVFSRDKVWDGGAGDGKWSSALNWNDDLVPTASDTVRFNGLSVAACNLNVPATVAGFVMTSSYPGVFSFTNQTLTVQGTADFRSGGAINAGTGELRFENGLPAQLYPRTSTTIMPAITVAGDSVLTIVGTGLNAPSVQVERGVLDLGVNLIHTFGGLNGGATLDFDSSTIQFTGATLDLSIFGQIVPDNGTLILTGAIPQTVRSCAGVMPKITQKGTGGTTLVSNLSTALLTMAQGTFNLGAELQVNAGSVTSANPNTGTLDFSSSTLSVTSGSATFTSIVIVPSSGSLVFSSPGNQNFTPRAGALFPPIVQNNQTGRTTVTNRGFNAPSVTIAAGTFVVGTALRDTVEKISGSGILNMSSGALVITGDTANFGSLAGVIAGTGMIYFAGNAPQYLIPRNNDTLPGITHAVPNALKCVGAPCRTLSFTQSAGSYNFNEFDLTTVSSGNFIITNGNDTTLQNLDGRTITVDGNASVTGDSLNVFALNPTSPWIMSVRGTLNANWIRLANSTASRTQGFPTNSIDEGNNSGWIFSSFKVWTGLAGDGLWSTAANWSDNVEPSVADTAKFSGSSQVNCVINVDDTVGSIIISPAYTGKIDFSGNILTVLNIVNLQTGGTFGTSGGIRMAGTTPQILYPKAGAKVPLIIQEGAGGTTISSQALTAGSVVVAGGTLSMGSGLAHTLDSLSGSGIFNFGASTVYVRRGADFSGFSRLIAGTGTLNFNGTTSTWLVPSLQDTLPNLTQSGTVGLSLSGALLARTVTISQGLVTSGNGYTHRVIGLTSANPNIGRLDFGSSTIKVSGATANLSNITILPGTGTLSFANSGANSFTPSAKSASILPNLVQEGTGTTTVRTRGFRTNRLILQAGTFALGAALVDTVSVVKGSGSLSFGDATLRVYGDSADFSQMSRVLSSTGTIVFNQSQTQHLVAHANDTLPSISHVGSGTLVLGGSLLRSRGFANDSGSVDFGGCNITTVAAGNFTINNGTSSTFINLGGRTITVDGAATLTGTVNSLLNLNPVSSWTISVAGALIATNADLRYSTASRTIGRATNSVDHGNNSRWDFMRGVVWHGTAGDGKWSTAANWSAGRVPGVADTVYFSGDYPMACLLDVNDTIAALICDGVYSSGFAFDNHSLWIMQNANVRGASSLSASSGAIVFFGSEDHVLTPPSSGRIPSLAVSGSGTVTVAGRIRTARIELDGGTLVLGSGYMDTVGNFVGRAGNVQFGTSALTILADTASFSGLDAILGTSGTLRFSGTGLQYCLPHATDTLPAIVHGSASELVLAGSTLKTVGFTNSNGSLNLNGNDIFIVKNGNLSVTSGTSSTFRNLAGRTITVAGTALLTGQSGNLLNLNPTAGWALDATGSLTANWAALGNSTALRTQGLAANCVDNGNNVNWRFPVPDTLLVTVKSVMTADTLAELQAAIPALRFLVRHPNNSGTPQQITKITCYTSVVSPPTTIARKRLRIPGAIADIYSSTSIEGANPLVLTLSKPFTVHPGETDSLDLLFDLTNAPASTIDFSMNFAEDIITKDSATGVFAFAKPEDGASFPMHSALANILVDVTTPSGKTTDGTVADWTPVAERLDQSKGGDDFYMTWDKSYIHIAYSGRDLATDGNLFVYFGTKSGGASLTNNYLGQGAHNLPSGFGGADYAIFVGDTNTYGLLDGANGYATLPFDGSISMSGTSLEISIARTALGSPDSFYFIPFIQKKNSAEILISWPHDNVDEFTRNPVGIAPQNFLSWMNARLANGLTPVALTKFNAVPVVKPTWSVSLGNGNYAASMTGGRSTMYAATGGVSPAMTTINAVTGAIRWVASCAYVPTSLSRYYEISTAKDIIFFCDGNRFRAGYDNPTSFGEFAWSPLVLPSTGSTPNRSIPPDGGGGDTVYAYFNTAAGTMYKVKIKTGAVEWISGNIAVSVHTNIVTLSDRLYTGCVNGDLMQIDPASGGVVASVNVGDSVKFPFVYASAIPALYCAPRGQTLYGLSTNLMPMWTKNLGSNFGAGVSYYFGSKPAALYCPVGDSLIALRDDTTKASRLWSYSALGALSTNPASSSSVIYFGSQDKRLYAVNRFTGISMPAWPSAVLDGPNQSRLIIDGTLGAVFFGGGDGKIYRFPKQ